MKTISVLIAWILCLSLGGGPAGARQEKGVDKAVTEVSTLRDQIVQLKEQNAALASELAKEKERALKLEKDCNGWAKESQALAVLKRALAASNTQLSAARLKARMEESRADRLERSAMIKWFLAGVGVLLFGLFLGLALRPKPQRWSHLR